MAISLHSKMKPNVEKYSSPLDFGDITFYRRHGFVNILKRLIILVLMFLVGCAVVLSPFLSLFIVLGSVLLICCYIKPILGLYTCVTLAPIMTMNVVYDSPTTIFSNYYRLSFIPIILTFSVWMVRRLSLPYKKNNRDYTIYIFPFVLLIWAMISVLWSLDLYHGINITFNLSMSIFFFFLLTNLIADKYSLEKLLYYMVLLGVLFASITFLSSYVSTTFSVEITKRWSFLIKLYHLKSVLQTGEIGIRAGGFAPPQPACNILGFFILVIIAVYPRLKNYWNKLLFIIFATFLFLNMLLTASKGGILSFVVGIFFLIFFNPKLRKKAILWSFLAITFFVSLNLVNYFLFKETRLVGSSGSGVVAVGSFIGRLELWKAGFEMLSNRWIGAGAGGFLTVVDPIPGAHSLYFSILFDLGIIGFIIFALFIMEAALRLRRAIKKCADEFVTWTLYCLSASFIMLLIHSLVDIDYTYNYFWFVVGLVFVVIRIAMETDSQSLCPSSNR